MARVTWFRQALAKLELIEAYVGQFDPDAAHRIATRLFEAGNSLAVFPNRGRLAKYGTRALVIVRPYVLLYEVDGDKVSILDIVHAAQLGDSD